MKQWYAVYTKPHKESQVASQLETKGIETYLPAIREHDQKDSESRPFFPCYLFIHTEIITVPPAILKWTPGLRRVVSYDNVPIPLPSDFIPYIQSKLSELNARKKSSPIPFEPGDEVRITRGCFQDLVAIFEGPTTPSKRVSVLLTALGQPKRLRLNPANLEKCKRSAHHPGNDRRRRRRRTRGKGRRITYNKQIAKSDYGLIPDPGQSVSAYVLLCFFTIRLLTVGVISV